MVFGVNSLQSVATVIASVRFRCKYSFRCRAALDNAPVLGMTITYKKEEDGRVYRDKEITETKKDGKDDVPVERSLESLTRSQLITLVK